MDETPLGPNEGETEWEDALIKHGIMTKRPDTGPTDDELALAVQEAMEDHDELQGKTLEELDEAEDDFDEDVLNQYREARLAELKKRQEADKFGEVRQISEPDFVKEVTEASKDVCVFLHLFNYGRLECKIMDKYMIEAARRIKSVKFLKIIAQECIHNYPEANCPTILIYHKGDIARQVVGLTDFGGRRMNADCIEWMLACMGIVQTEMETDPRLELAANVRRKVQTKRRGDSDSDSDSDW